MIIDGFNFIQLLRLRSPAPRDRARRSRRQPHRPRIAERTRRRIPKEAFRQARKLSCSSNSLSTMAGSPASRSERQPAAAEAPRPSVRSRPGKPSPSPGTNSRISSRATLSSTLRPPASNATACRGRRHRHRRRPAHPQDAPTTRARSLRSAMRSPAIPPAVGRNSPLVVVFNATFNRTMLERAFSEQLDFTPEFLWIDLHFLLPRFASPSAWNVRSARRPDGLRGRDLQRHHALGDAWAIAQLFLGWRSRAHSRSRSPIRALAEHAQ